jgi:hypothetical protein
MPNFALCGGENEELGLLGRHLWFRCRSCGLEDYMYTPPQEKETDDE